MKTTLLVFILFFSGADMFAQSLAFNELGSHPAYCRLFPYQNGGGAVYASASGGTADYTYLWTNIQTGFTASNPTWGGLNPGYYEIKVTDDIGDVLIDTVYVDSVNVVASFTEYIGNLTPVPQGYVGFSSMNVQFANTTTGFANPNDPFTDTTFFWQMKQDLPWEYRTDLVSPLTFYTSGSYMACLMVSTSNNCSDTICKEIFIFGPASIDENQNNSTKFFTIYSSHHSNTIHFNCGGFDEGFLVEIYSVSGQLMTSFETTTKQSEIPFDQSRGVYLYRISGLKSKELLGSGKLIH